MLLLVAGGSDCRVATDRFSYYARRFLASSEAIRNSGREPIHTPYSADRHGRNPVQDIAHSYNVSKLGLWGDQVNKACGFSTE